MNSFAKARSYRLLSLFCSGFLISGTIVAQIPAASAQAIDIEPGLPALPQTNELPRPVAQKLLQKVAQDTNQPLEQLRITAVKSTYFDGCFGFYNPGQACTMIAIAGWQAVVTSPTRAFVYHLNQDGSQIGRNTTASGARPPIRVSFINQEELPFPEPPVIFRSSAPGSLKDSTLIITLTEDGKVTEWLTAPYIKSAPVLRKTLTPAQVTAFKSLLENRRFPNLNGLAYLSSGIVPVTPTTYQSIYGTTQFARSDRPNLPRSLQQVVISWENLMRK